MYKAKETRAYCCPHATFKVDDTYINCSMYYNNGGSVEMSKDKDANPTIEVRFPITSELYVIPIPKCKKRLRQAINGNFDNAYKIRAHEHSFEATVRDMKFYCKVDCEHSTPEFIEYRKEVYKKAKVANEIIDATRVNVNVYLKVIDLVEPIFKKKIHYRVLDNKLILRSETGIDIYTDLNAEFIWNTNCVPGSIINPLHKVGDICNDMTLDHSIQGMPFDGLMPIYEVTKVEVLS